MLRATQTTFGPAGSVLTLQPCGQLRSSVVSTVCIIDASLSMGETSELVLKRLRMLKAPYSKADAVFLFGGNVSKVAANAEAASLVHVRGVAVDRGWTNISAAVEAGVNHIDRCHSNFKKTSTKVVYQVIMLTDGGQNVRTAPDPVVHAEALSKGLMKKHPDIQISWIPIGLTSASLTNVGITISNILSTVQLDREDPNVKVIYYCDGPSDIHDTIESLNAVKSLLAQGATELVEVRGDHFFFDPLSGPVSSKQVTLSRRSAHLLCSAGPGGKADVWVNGKRIKVDVTKTHDRQALEESWMTVVGGLRLAKVDVTVQDARVHDAAKLALETADRMIEAQRRLYPSADPRDAQSQAGRGIGSASHRHKEWLKLLGRAGTNSAEELWHRRAHNALNEVLTFSDAQNSRKAADFLNGHQDKFASKARARASKSIGNADSVEELADAQKKTAHALQGSMCEDARCSLSKVGPESVSLTEEEQRFIDSTSREGDADPNSLGLSVLRKVYDAGAVPSSVLSLCDSLHYPEELIGTWLGTPDEVSDVFGGLLISSYGLGIACRLESTNQSAMAINMWPHAKVFVGGSHIGSEEVLFMLKTGSPFEDRHAPCGALDVNFALPLVSPLAPETTLKTLRSRGARIALAAFVAKDLNQATEHDERVLACLGHALSSILSEENFSEMRSIQVFEILYTANRFISSGPRSFYDDIRSRMISGLPLTEGLAGGSVRGGYVQTTLALASDAILATLDAAVRLQINWRQCEAALVTYFKAHPALHADPNPGQACYDMGRSILAMHDAGSDFPIPTPMNVENMSEDDIRELFPIHLPTFASTALRSPEWAALEEHCARALRSTELVVAMQSMFASSHDGPEGLLQRGLLKKNSPEALELKGAMLKRWNAQLSTRLCGSQEALRCVLWALLTSFNRTRREVVYFEIPTLRQLIREVMMHEYERGMREKQAAQIAKLSGDIEAFVESPATSGYELATWIKNQPHIHSWKRTILTKTARRAKELGGVALQAFYEKAVPTRNLQSGKWVNNFSFVNGKKWRRL